MSKKSSPHHELLDRWIAAGPQDVLLEVTVEIREEQ
jgi:hypothetical protein